MREWPCSKSKKIKQRLGAKNSVPAAWALLFALGLAGQHSRSVSDLGRTLAALTSPRIEERTAAFAQIAQAQPPLWANAVVQRATFVLLETETSGFIRAREDGTDEPEAYYGYLEDVSEAACTIAGLSPSDARYTAILKAYFIYGRKVERWLAQRGARHAAELLRLAAEGTDYQRANAVRVIGLMLRPFATPALGTRDRERLNQILAAKAESGLGMNGPAQIEAIRAIGDSDIVADAPVLRKIASSTSGNPVAHAQARGILNRWAQRGIH